MYRKAFNSPNLNNGEVTAVDEDSGVNAVLSAFPGFESYTRMYSYGILYT